MRDRRRRLRDAGVQERKSKEPFLASLSRAARHRRWAPTQLHPAGWRWTLTHSVVRGCCAPSALPDPFRAPSASVYRLPHARAAAHRRRWRSTRRGGRSPTAVAAGVASPRHSLTLSRASGISLSPATREGGRPPPAVAEHPARWPRHRPRAVADHPRRWFCGGRRLRSSCRKSALHGSCSDLLNASAASAPSPRPPPRHMRVKQRVGSAPSSLAASPRARAASARGSSTGTVGK